VQFLMESARHGADDRAMEIDPEAEAYLLAYAWPGNVRELDNVINRARILAENDCITVGDLPIALVDSVKPQSMNRQDLSEQGSLREQLQRIELEIIRHAIDAAQGDRRLAAQRLGIGLSSVYRKLGDATISE